MSAQLQAQISKPLTDVSLQTVSQGLIADEVLPEKKTKQYSGIIGAYGQEHLRNEDDEGGGRGGYKRVDSVDYDLTKTFLIKNRGLEDIVTEEDRANYEEIFDAESDKVVALTQKVSISKELRCASKLTSTAYLTNNVTLSGTSQFSDLNNSDPLGVIATAHAVGVNKKGMQFNTAIIPNLVKLTLKRHPQILAELGYSPNRAGYISDSELADIFQVQKIIWAGGIYNSAKKGQANSISQIWGSNIVLYHRAPSAAEKQLCLGYLMRPMSAPKRQVYKYAINNPPNATGIIVKEGYDFAIADADSGYLIKSVI